MFFVHVCFNAPVREVEAGVLNLQEGDRRNGKIQDPFQTANAESTRLHHDSAADEQCLQEFVQGNWSFRKLFADE